ncbi:DinB family protein [Vallicoccus soli]|uniref:DinB family protein n=1 Tax=Vallicoccus soli TaxID=2339232 RepID=A0A3A3YX28_9ACTN|nr:DinB family protein [Vallicoccus soli]
MQDDGRGDLLAYLRDGRAALVWKLEGLAELDVRRPLTPTGTNLLGLVKHLAHVEAGYLGGALGRPFPDLPWPPRADDADLWARADEPREAVLDLYRRAQEHAEATVAALPPGAVGEVPWWPPGRRRATVHHLLVRVLTDTQRHAGQADVLREGLDGAAGLLPGTSSLAEEDPGRRAAYRDRLEAVARDAARRAGGRV